MKAILVLVIFVAASKGKYTSSNHQVDLKTGPKVKSGNNRFVILYKMFEYMYFSSSA